MCLKVKLVPRFKRKWQDVGTSTLFRTDEDTFNKMKYLENILQMQL